jgi:hypothetical protein
MATRGSAPERLQHYDDLRIDCAGDEYDYPDADGRFRDASFFDFGGEVGFGACWFDGAFERCGSASASFRSNPPL